MLDYEAMMGKLAQLVVLAFFLERALAFLFELRLELPGRRASSGTPPRTLGDSIGSFFKSAATVGLAWFICSRYDFDVIATLFGRASSSGVERGLTALIAAGGSAGAIKLFQDVLGMSKAARDAGREATEARAMTRKLEAEASLATARKALAAAKGSTGEDAGGAPRD